jgi:hypothetical protein
MFRVALVGSFLSLIAGFVALAAARRGQVGRKLAVTGLVFGVIATGAILTRAWLPPSTAARLTDWWQNDVLPDPCDQAPEEAGCGP